MNLKTYRTPIIISLCVLQILFLLAGVIHVNIILAAGEEVIIEMDGYDPYDPFRGRYLQLAVADSTSIPLAINSLERYVDDDDYYYGERMVYVVLGKSQENTEFDTFLYATLDEPTGNEIYIKCEASNYLSDEDTVEIYPRLDTYYVNERDAIELDPVVRSSDSEVHLILKVFNGGYAIDGIIINGERY